MKKSSSSAGASKLSKAGKTTIKKSSADKVAKKTTKASPKKTGGLSMKERMAEAKKLEALDSGKVKAHKPKSAKAGKIPLKLSHPQRNDDFPNTYIQQISVVLDDPDHPMTLTWTGPNADAQE